MPSNEVDKTKGESILIARHTKRGQSGVEQWLVQNFVLHFYCIHRNRTSPFSQEMRKKRILIVQ